ncbi:MAG: lycopene cyclase domain-containing protein, partial [Verrucomicrobiota bacterium]
LIVFSSGPMLSQYPFLFASAALVILVAVCSLSWNWPKRLLLAVALVNAPLGVLEVFFVPEYWEPKKLFDWIVGPEDFLFSGAVGVVGWIAAFGSSRGVQWSRDLRQVLLRFLSLFFSYVAGLWVLDSTSIRVMPAAIIVLIMMGAALGFYRRELLKYVARGALYFTLFYFVFLRVSFSVWSDWVYEWNLEEMWSLRIFGGPIEELLWAILYGAVSPLATGYILNILPPDSPIERGPIVSDRRLPSLRRR